MDPLLCRTSSFSSSSSGKTSDLKHVTDLSKANTVIPKPIQWKDVNLPEEWILEGAAPPAIPKQLEPNTELQNVTQYSDAPDTPQSSKIGVLEHDQVSIASSDLETFKDEPTPKANKIHWDLALPIVRSPPDLAINNRPSALNQSRFNASSVYEWNIDGMSEYNILGLLQQMTMAANAYKTQSGTSDKTIAEILIAGFTGQLKGDPSHLRDKNAELLHNLRCRKLSEFLAGLPTLLGEKKRLKWELKKSKQELGSFCKQFNYDPFKTPTSKDCNGECSSKPYKKHYKSKSHRKPFQDFRKLSYKKPSRPYKKPSFSKKKGFRAKLKAPFNYKEATCYKCGQKGHTVKFCRINRKLQELGLDEEILYKVAPLLIESSDSESSMSGDSDPLQVDELIDSDTSAYSSSDSESDSYLKKINVLTKDQEIFLELVKHISDPNLQKEYLDKLLKTLDSNKAETSKVPIVKKNSYDLTEILDKKKIKKTTPNIQDLQKEIKEIKLEIKELKEKQKNDSETIQLLLQKQLEDNSDKEVESDDDNNEQDLENIKSVPNDFLFVLKQITTRKYLIKITLIFSKDFAIEAIALFDTGADLNCIREDIVPKRFHEKTNERLSAANNSKLKVNSKVEASIHNNNLEFKTSFVLTNDIHHAVILGTPFINLITPYTVSYDGSSCFGITGGAAPSRIHSSGRLTSFHWIGFGMTVLALDRSVFFPEEELEKDDVLQSRESIGLLQQMTMAANDYKTQSETSNKAITEILIAGFTGQLKGWWDHLLTKLQQ
ncbi:hypothetical protein KPL71_023981 [Citrus sinensis]|uniref:Uncharacterized protein n=1 Tax=Citrus sinensis TaxID=2711 RepID=A0ACB8IN82_CITSI|nr:hypothetical protein KPL71_023981 [Citrus sinensis]